MEPLEPTYRGSEWQTGPRLFGPHGEDLPYPRFDRGAHGYYVDFVPGWDEFRPRYSRQQPPRGEHAWHGGVLGWLGSGLRAYTAWLGNQLQTWGARVGGTLKGTGDDLGRAMRGRGEQVGSAMEQRGEELMRSMDSYGRPSRSYRRPDDRILDDLHQRIALSGVDAEAVEIEVNNGVVTLAGRVLRRFDKRLIEGIAEQVFGVQEVQNHLRLARRVDERGPTSEHAVGGNGHGSTFSGTEPRS